VTLPQVVEERAAAEQAAAAADPLLLQARGVGKAYRIYDRPADRLKQMLFSRFGRDYGREFWALREVSLELRRGETLGILGRNGSGKSTLLQLLAGTLAPSQGEVESHGRLAALLELGSGFNPEFTGRENVILNGSILGIPRQEMERRFDDVATFADIGDFIDQPVKVYSSGMFVRLAFAVATAVEPDVLILDEALAVGDVFFRQKCYRRLEQLREQGVAIILVSHAATEVEQFCRRAMVLDHGRVVFAGPASEAVKRYYLLEQGATLVSAEVEQEREREEAELGEHRDLDTLGSWPAASAFLNLDGRPRVEDGSAHLLAVAVTDGQGRPCVSFPQGAIGRFYFEVEVRRPLEVPVGGVVIHDQRGNVVHGKNSLHFDCPVPPAVAVGTRLRYRVDLGLELGIGDYTFDVGFASLSLADYRHRAEMAYDDLVGRIAHRCVVTGAGSFNVTYRPLGTRPIQLLHHGLANLPGDCGLAVLGGAAAR
jgi:lipopolysaccharide transport system ATP-binding protein